MSDTLSFFERYIWPVRLPMDRLANPSKWVFFCRDREGSKRVKWSNCDYGITDCAQIMEMGMELVFIDILRCEKDFIERYISLNCAGTLVCDWSEVWKIQVRSVRKTPNVHHHESSSSLGCNGMGSFFLPNV